MRRVAEDMGLDISGLKPVAQAGCTYASLPGSGSSSNTDSAAAGDSSSSGADAGSASPVSIAALLSKAAAAAAVPKTDSKADAKADTKAASKPAETPADSKELDPLAVTQKVELSISVGGKPAGTVTLGMFGNAVPKTVANVSGRANVAMVDLRVCPGDSAC